MSVLTKDLNIIEIRSQIHNLNVLRGFSSLTLTQSLMLQENLNALQAIDKKAAEAEEIIREKIQSVRAKEGDVQQYSAEGKAELERIEKEAKELVDKKHKCKFKTLDMSVFPEDIGSRPPKKVTYQNGMSIEYSYLECLLDSIGYSVTIKEEAK